MMTIRIPYGDDKLEITVPDEHFGGLIEQKRQVAARNVSSLIKDSLAADRLGEFLGDSTRVLVVVNDSYRWTPSHLVLAELSQYLRKISDVRLIVATGLHRKPTDSEIDRILGDGCDISRSGIAYSDAYDADQFDCIGKWRSGKDVLVHKLFGWAEKVIVISSVEPHYFAGFSGGPKSFVPGLAHKSTIEANHSLAVSSDCQPCILEGNPFAESLREAVDLLDLSRVYAIQLVLNTHEDVVGVFTGDLWSSFGRAVDCARSVFVEKVDRQYPVVVAVNSPPLDRNLYQMQKVYENTKGLVMDGGSIIVVSKCQEGVGNDEFLNLAAKYPEPQDVLNAKVEGWSLGFHKLYRTALAKKRISIFAKTDVDPEIVRRVYLDPIDDLQSKINEELEKFGKESKVMFILDAGHVVPHVDRAA
ncbi:MAG: nickel-dependent lactate racemase [candidate division Zixibacteria bacterium]|nr:nickel-dependent lactate racemase [candidate division Zixibacteria bacterium]MBU2624171.1 nickel-dependent lactate racemase [candidate division Zixibacteria bacterium]